MEDSLAVAAGMAFGGVARYCVCCRRKKDGLFSFFVEARGRRENLGISGRDRGTRGYGDCLLAVIKAKRKERGGRVR